MSEYHEASGGVIREADNAFIPEAEDNRDWVEYLAWRAAGGVPEPAEIAVPVDPPASMLRFEAFQVRADPLFFKWQVALADGSENAEELKQAWLDEREAIKLECRD